MDYSPIHGKWFLQTQISKKSDCGVRLLPLSFSLLRRLVQYFESQIFESLLANQRENSGGGGEPYNMIFRDFGL